MRSKPRYAVRKVYAYSCHPNSCDCKGTHYTYNRKDAEKHSRDGYESVRVQFEVMDYDDNQVIADCSMEKSARKIAKALNNDGLVA